MQIWPHKHIHTLANFSIQDYESVFELANRFDALKNAGTKKIPALQGTLVTSLFFEASTCLLYTSPSPRDEKVSRMPSSA